MDFHIKLQELRKQKGLTQEELAELIFVSRTAVSKWESGRGYPNIDSLRALAKFFGVTVDTLLSGEELLFVSEEDTRKKESRIRSLVFGLLDLGAAMLFFLPFFGEVADNTVKSVSLFSLTNASPYLIVSYFATLSATVLVGVLTLALQVLECGFLEITKNKISLFLSALGVLLFIISQQPYAATFLLTFLLIKALMLIKWR